MQLNCGVLPPVFRHADKQVLKWNGYSKQHSVEQNDELYSLQAPLGWGFYSWGLQPAAVSLLHHQRMFYHLLGADTGKTNEGLMPTLCFFLLLSSQHIWAQGQSRLKPGVKTT